MLKRSAPLVPLGVFVAIILLLLSPSLLGGKILSSGDVVFFQGPFFGEKPASLTAEGNSEMFDPVLVFQPDLITIRRALESGEIGLWTPYQQGGRPLWASQQTAPLFPLTWLAFVASFWRALALIGALKLLLAAVGAYALGRWLGLARGPAVLAGVAYAFCTYINDGLQFPLSAVMAMMPWAMMMAGRVGRHGRVLDALGLMLAVGLTLLTGSPELITIALGGVVAYALYELAATVPGGGEPPPASRRRRLGLLLLGGVGGLALSAAALGPFAEFLTLANTTSRGGVGIYPNSIAYSFFFPELWGSPDKALGQFGPINYTERTAYIGALPVLLAVGGVFARRPRGVHLFWIVFTVAAALIAMHSFVHDFVSELPGPDKVGLLRALMLIDIGGALLAGFGLQAWLQADGRARVRMMSVMVIAALVPAAFLLRDVNPFSHFGAALGEIPSLSRTDVAMKEFIKQIVAWRWLVFCGIGLVLLTLSRRIPNGAVAAAVIALVAADLLTVDAGYNPQIPLSEADPPKPPALGYLQSSIGHQRMTGTLTSDAVGLQANLAERYALRDMDSYNFPKTARWADLWGAYGQSTGDQNDWNPELPKSHAVLDAFAVSYVVPPAGIRGPSYLRARLQPGAGLSTRAREPDCAAASLGGLRLAPGLRPAAVRRRDSGLEHRRAAQPARARRSAAVPERLRASSAGPGHVPGRQRRIRVAAGARPARWLRGARRLLLPGLAGHRRRPSREDRASRRELPSGRCECGRAHDRLPLSARFVPRRRHHQHPRGPLHARRSCDCSRAPPAIADVS